MDEYDAKRGGPAVGAYWQTSNSSTDTSATSYVPEIPWNDSCASQLIDTVEGYTQPYGSTGFCSSTTGQASFITTSSGSGGPSTLIAQPSWQTGVPGLPTASGGVRYLPDVSLFAANGVWGHFYVYCMSDTAQGGVACNFSNTTDTLGLAAGGTSFAAPALAGIQALVNQKTESRQGNPNYTFYALAAQQVSGGASCGSDQGAPASPSLPAASCIFNDVTAGDIDLPCTGTANCFGYTKSHGKTTGYGALSVSSSAYTPAYPAGTGWDYATGLGSLNAYNLVTNWAEASADAGADAAVDAATDAHADSASDTGVDAEAGAGVDAGAGAEAGSGTTGNSDAASDGGADASGSPDATSSAGGPCTGGTLTGMPGSPQPAGTAATLSATSSTCLSPQYEYWVGSPGSVWTVLQPWTASNSFSWDTTGMSNGNYQLEVWIKDASSSALYYDTYAVLPFTIIDGAPPACTGATLAGTPGSPQPAGTPVMLSATSSTCLSPQYEYWVGSPASVWTVLQSWTTSSSLSWSTTGLSNGTYQLEVFWVKDASSSAAMYYDAMGAPGRSRSPTARRRRARVER